MKKSMLIASAVAIFSFTISIHPVLAAEPMFGQDTNASITHDQFIQHAEEHFKKIDTNHDGVISPDERKAAHEQMRGKRKEWREKHSAPSK